MKCSHLSDLFEEYLHDTLTSEEKQALSEHLKGCPSCQKQWEAYRFFFENTKIEDDFLVPSQLNAKIKYTIHEAKNQKKVPFFQNRQLLAGLTACSFLLVAGIWSGAHYEQLKEIRYQNEISVSQPEVTPQVSDLSNEPAVISETKPQLTENTPKNNLKSSESKPEAVPAGTETKEQSQEVLETESQNSFTIAPISTPEAVQEKVLYDATPATGSGGAHDASSEETTTAKSRNVQPMAANTPAPDATAVAPVSNEQETEEDVITYGMTEGSSAAGASFASPVSRITVSKAFSQEILSYSHTKISENCYLVTITKEALESILKEPVFSTDGADSFLITFE